MMAVEFERAKKLLVESYENDKTMKLGERFDKVAAATGIARNTIKNYYYNEWRETFATKMRVRSDSVKTDELPRAVQKTTVHKPLKTLEDLVGHVLQVTVSRIVSYGLFVNVNGFPVSGLVHVSEISTAFLAHADLIRRYSVGEKILVRVLPMVDQKRLALGVIQLLNPSVELRKIIEEKGILAGQVTRPTVSDDELLRLFTYTRPRIDSQAVEQNLNCDQVATSSQPTETVTTSELSDFDRVLPLIIGAMPDEVKQLSPEAIIRIQKIAKKVGLFKLGVSIARLAPVFKPDPSVQFVARLETLLANDLEGVYFNYSCTMHVLDRYRERVLGGKAVSDDTVKQRILGEIEQCELYCQTNTHRYLRTSSGYTYVCRLAKKRELAHDYEVDTVLSPDFIVTIQGEAI